MGAIPALNLVEGLILECFCLNLISKKIIDWNQAFKAKALESAYSQSITLERFIVVTISTISLTHTHTHTEMKGSDHLQLIRLGPVQKNFSVCCGFLT